MIAFFFLVAATVVVIVSEYLPDTEAPSALFCKAVGNPLPNVTWIGPEGKVKEISTGKARIPLKENDKGRYTCVARNTEGSSNKSFIVARKYFCRPNNFFVYLFVCLFCFLCSYCFVLFCLILSNFIP